MRRLLIVWLILAATGAVIVVIARREPLPDTLQAFGFDDCAGEPCLRGVTRGMSWDEAISKIPNAKPFMRRLFVPFDKARFGFDSVDRPTDYYLTASSDMVFESISIYPTEGLHVPIGGFVEQYGKPCGVSVSDSDDFTIALQYPKFVVWIEIPREPSSSSIWDRTLIFPTSLVSGVTIRDNSRYCRKTEPSYSSIAWQGLSHHYVQDYFNQLILGSSN